MKNKTIVLLLIFTLINSHVILFAQTIPKNGELSFGGYVKLDYIHDFKPIGNVNYFDVSTIPVPQKEGQNVHFQANETRLFTEYKLTTDNLPMRAFIEGDFYGTNGAFRLRHAFVEVGSKHRLLGGQYWSNFMDEDIIPATLDFEKPVAYAFVRHALIRYAYVSGKHQVGIALEEPSKNIQTSVPGTLENYLPDLTARYRYTGAKGHLQLSAFAASNKFVPDSGSNQYVQQFGINLSGKYNLPFGDVLTFQGLFGPGVARYRGGKSAAPDQNNELTPITGIGAFIGYQHFWNKKWSSLVVANYGTEKRVYKQAITDNLALTYTAANLCWQFTPQAMAGIEYLYGQRMLFSEASADAHRIQFSLKMNFSSK